jgi:CRISPR system Cascade subunit CasB
LEAKKIKSQSKIIYAYINKKITSLLYHNDESYVRALLAQMRRSIDKHPGRVPEVWDFVLGEMPAALYCEINEQSHGPSPGQKAVYISLTMFALHQQGKNIREKSMYKPKASFGEAIRILVYKRGLESEKAIKRRFDSIVTSDDLSELSRHLRGLINLLKDESISLDYAQLAVDLYFFQMENHRDDIRLKWGQAYYHNYRKDEHENGSGD